MGTPRTYTVRGIDPSAGPFTCLGAAKDLPNFVQIEQVPTEAKAIELLLTHPSLSKMVTGVPPVSTSAHVDVLNIKLFVANVASVTEAKAIRKQLADEILNWAEKSRVRGVRGWRAHAIKTPKMQRLHSSSNVYELDFDAIFGHAIFYNDRQMQVGKVEDPVFTAETIQDLRRHLDRQHPGLVQRIDFANEAADIGGSA